MDKPTFYINSTLVANTIRKGIDYGKVYSIKSVKQAKTDLIIEDNNESSDLIIEGNDKSSERISYIDMMIMDAVYSLYCTNETWISPGKILRMLSGNEKQTCRKETRKRINHSLEKMAALNINLDYAEEMISRKKELAYKGEVAFIELDKLKKNESHKSKKISHKLKKVKSYKWKKIKSYKWKEKGTKYSNLQSPPVLYEYAECLKQMISIPWDVWKLEDGEKSKKRDSLDNLALKHYLFQRIHTANYLKNKNPKSHMERIYYYRSTRNKEKNPYEGMLFELGIVAWDKISVNEDGKKNDMEAVRKKLAVIKRKIHENTKKILESMIKIGYIGGYTLIKGIGREIIGVEISLKDAKKEYIIDGFTLIKGSGGEIIGVDIRLKDAEK